jgi:hypothetical protein
MMRSQRFGSRSTLTSRTVTNSATVMRLGLKIMAREFPELDRQGHDVINDRLTGAQARGRFSLMAAPPVIAADKMVIKRCSEGFKRLLSATMRFESKRLLQLVDWELVAVAVALPWSTSATILHAR